MKKNVGYLKKVFMKDLNCSSLNLEIARNSEKLIVSFGGVAGYPGMPIFEFKKLMTSVELNKLFVVDPNRAWYCLGICEDINSSQVLLDKLKTIIELYGKKYTMFYGNSMGGFAALKLGALLSVDKVIAFSPQTFINEQLRVKYKDSR